MAKKTLYANDLVIGGKYVPNAKSINSYSHLSRSVVWKRAQERNQPYIYYVGIYEEFGEKYFTFNDINDDSDGDFFCPSDVTPYRVNIFKRIYHGVARVFYTMCRMEAEERHIAYQNQEAAIEYFENKIKQHTI